MLADSAGSSAGRCCHASGWLPLGRAAGEGSRWATAALALCVLCEAAPSWQDERLLEVLGLVDEHLDCRSSQTCSEAAFCGSELWAPLVASLRRAVACAEVAESVEKGSSMSAQPHYFSFNQTMAHLQGGGSLMRMNDGEQGTMHPGFNAPLSRLTDTMLRLQLAAKAECPGLCVGMLNPDDKEAILAIGPTHLSWWMDAGFRVTRELMQTGHLAADRNYCFGLVNYRPKTGPETLDMGEFRAAWSAVFTNRTVLIVAPADSFFNTRCGNCRPISPLLYGHGSRIAPFKRARKVYALNPLLLHYSHEHGAQWQGVVQAVQEAAKASGATLVAVSWGTGADILVSELACRGLQAIDVGNLYHTLMGGKKARNVDIDEEVTE
ncbi:unnamed protein product [Polarella glacialis]|uniref:Uncharacterized protein n=1 Tax=Polarella glacialis TaxID=89957 RepID=A0A813G242_POLGL|nr:unnamed protein product [Polarella glacialis]